MAKKSKNNSTTSTKQLDLSKSLLSTIVNQNAGSIYIIQDQRIIFHNASFASLTGYTSSQLQELRFIDLVHPKDRKLITLLFKDEYREIVQKPSHSFTFRIQPLNAPMRWLKAGVTLINWEGKAALLSNAFEITQQKEFEEKLIDEENNFRLLVNAFEDLVFIVSSRGTVIQANQSVYNRLGLREHEVVLRNFAGLFAISQRPQIKEMLTKSMQGQRAQGSASIICSSIIEIPVEIRFFNGKWSGRDVVFAICQDITLRLETERTIRLSEEKFSKAFNTNAVMMSISTLKDGIYLDVNEALLATLERSREEVIGRRSSDLNIFDAISLRDELVDHVVNTGKVTDRETTIRSASGRIYRCLLYTETIFIQGKPCLLTAMSDVTQRKLAEEKLQLSEQRFRQMAELFPEMIFESDAKGTITFANRILTSTFGIDSAQMDKGLSFRNLFSREHSRAIRDYIRNAKHSPELPSVELVAQTLGGKKFPAIAHIIAIVEENRVIRFMGIMVDNTTRKLQQMELIRAKEQAEEASRAKEQFLSTMSHEIRTPMNAVIGMANLILQENPLDHQRDNLNTLKLSAENLMALLNDILDFSKIGAGKLVLDSAPVSLESIAVGVYKTFTHAASQKGIKLLMELDPKIPKAVLSDAVRITQILTNLVSNAIKFTNSGSVTLSLSCGRRVRSSVDVRFTVSDTGLGIPKHMYEEIFKEFTQVESSELRVHGGTGLGLAITKRLVELLGGSVTVSSREGVGSEFAFTLSLVTTSAAPKPRNKLDKIPPPTHSLRALRILVVEDNEINSTIVMRFLTKWGMEPHLAQDGAIALKKVAAMDFDLILMDLEMPVMSGYDATRAIRAMANPSKRDIPIVALTASAMLNVQKKIYSLGMNGFILKPFNPKDLHEKILELVKG